MDIQGAVRTLHEGPIPREFLRPSRPRRSVRVWRLAVLGAFWLGLVTSVVPWWLDTPDGFLDTPAIWMTAAGRITGLIAGYVLLVQVLLMSRVGWLERWIGARDMLHWHRELGVFVVVAVVAHVGFITFGYAAFERVGLPREVLRLLTIKEYAGMVAAFIATALLVAVALLSIGQLRRALPYEIWHMLHLTAYLALVLSFGHQFAVGQELSVPGWARSYYLALWIGVVACVVWGRLVRTALLNARHRFRVQSVVEEGKDVISIYIGGRRLDRLDARAGHFFRWRFLDGRSWWQAHPFSLSAAPNPQWLRVTVKVVGDHTRDLRRLRAGTRVVLEGPSGVFTADRRRHGRALLIAGGSGIAPIRALLEELPRRTVVLYRVRSADELVFHDEFELLVAAREAQVWYVTGGRDDPGPKRAFSPAGLRELVPDLTRRDVYLCGSAGLVESSVAALRRAGVPTRQIHLDPFEF